MAIVINLLVPFLTAMIESVEMRSNSGTQTLSRHQAVYLQNPKQNWKNYALRVNLFLEFPAPSWVHHIFALVNPPV